MIPSGPSLAQYKISSRAPGIPKENLTTCSPAMLANSRFITIPQPLMPLMLWLPKRNGSPSLTNHMNMGLDQHQVKRVFNRPHQVSDVWEWARDCLDIFAFKLLVIRLGSQQLL